MRTVFNHFLLRTSLCLTDDTIKENEEETIQKNIFSQVTKNPCSFIFSLPLLNPMHFFQCAQIIMRKKIH